MNSFTLRFGCLLVLTLLSATLASGVAAFMQPRSGIGIPAALAFGALTVLAVVQLTREERAHLARRRAQLGAVGPARGDIWKPLLRQEGLGRLVDELSCRVRTAVRLETRELQDPPGVLQSRIGGMPGLPAGLTWPAHRDLPMMFLAQLDLAEVARAAPDTLLPKTGHLYFFYSLAEPWGFAPEDAGSCRVLYQPPGFSPILATPPEGLPAEAQFKACGLQWVAYEDPPEHGAAEDKPLRWENDLESERYEEIREFLANGGEGPCHKLLGYADPIQGSMEWECQLVSNGINCGSPAGYETAEAELLKSGRSEWHLLLQLDTDRRPGMMWGDAGRLYFWIREADLKACRFEKTWLILQCG